MPWKGDGDRKRRLAVVLLATLSLASLAGSTSADPQTRPQAEEVAFRPQDLGSLLLYVESVATFTNPLTNADCLGPEDPNYCCTGAGTGICDEPVESFVVVDCTTRNLDCAAPGDPWACCTGIDTGSCCYEESDQVREFRGNSYCPESVCPEGCVNQWVDQSGHKSPNIGHPITGRTLEQDDLEKPCYKTDCINGHACVVGHPEWSEPGYPAAEQPKQDATMEIEPADRPAIRPCDGPFYIAQLVKIVPQVEDHFLLHGKIQYLVDENRIRFSPFSGGVDLSVNGVLPRLNDWYFIEVQRNLDDTMTIWVNEQDVTRWPPPLDTTDNPFSGLFCRDKSCDHPNRAEFQGEGALLVWKCGAVLTAQQQIEFRDYVRSTFDYLRIFWDDFESGDSAAWSDSSR